MTFIAVYLVCVFNDVIDYSVDKMVLVSLHVNEYRTCIRMNVYMKLQNGVFEIKSV